MRRVIGSVLLGLLCATAVAQGGSQPERRDPLRFFYNVHVHGPGGQLPETTPIAEADYQGVARVVRRLAQAFEARGARATFEFLQLVVDGAIKFEGPGGNLLTELEARGHEIAAHSHTGSRSLEQWRRVRERILAAGVREVTTIGSRTTDVPGDAGAAIAAQAGFSILTDNLCPADSRTLDFIKQAKDWGLGGNAGYERTLSFIHPWRPAFLRGDFNAHDPQGSIVYVDHVIGDWLIDEDAGETPASHGPMTTRHFDGVRPALKAALATAGSSEQITHFGLVSHEVEYQQGSVGTAYRATLPPVESAIAALDGFLADVQRLGQRVRFATVREVAQEFAQRTGTTLAPGGASGPAATEIMDGRGRELDRATVERLRDEVLARRTDAQTFAPRLRAAIELAVELLRQGRQAEVDRFFSPQTVARLEQEARGDAVQSAATELDRAILDLAGAFLGRDVRPAKMLGKQIRERRRKRTAADRSQARLRVRVPVAAKRLRLVDALPAAEKGADVRDPARAFRARNIVARRGEVELDLTRDPVYLIEGDIRPGAPVPAVESPFGFHPAVVLPAPGETPDPFGPARRIGVRWHRGLYAYWIKIQPTQEDIDGGIFHWEDNDREWGAVPESMAILGNIGLPERLQVDQAKSGVGPMKWTWTLNQSEENYLKFVRAVVERYDGDGTDDMPGLRVPIRHWQFENEPDQFSAGQPESSQAADREGFAHLQQITYDAIKDACPEAMVLMGGQTGGGIMVFETFYRPILQKLGGHYMDGFDLHYYGYTSLDWSDVREQYEHIRRALDESGYREAEIWITETGSYSGRPGDEEARTDPNDPAAEIMAQMPPREPLPERSEREQARDLIKRHVYALALGVKKVFWAFGLLEGFKNDDGYFDHTGLIYDGQFDQDPPRGTPKLGYFAYGQMTGLLDGADFARATILELGRDVYAVRLPRGRGAVTVLWYDPAFVDAASHPSGTQAGTTIRDGRGRTLDRATVERLRDEVLARRTDAQTFVPRLRAAIELAMELLRQGRQAEVDRFFAPDVVSRLEQEARGDGVQSAANELDRVILDLAAAFLGRDDGSSKKPEKKVRERLRKRTAAWFTCRKLETA